MVFTSSVYCDEYRRMDSLEKDVEIAAAKSEFDELLLTESAFFETTKPSFNPRNVNGTIAFSDFNTLYSKSNMATVKANHSVQNDVYQYEVQLKSNGPVRIGWAGRNCVFTENLGVGTETIFVLRT